MCSPESWPPYASSKTAKPGSKMLTAGVVNFDGNQPAQALLRSVFTAEDRAWRGIGTIPQSGWRLSDAYREFDAETRFSIGEIHTVESPLCYSGEVLQGVIQPTECPAFGRQCTPRTPLGATMVSSEGACAAYYNYGRFAPVTITPARVEEPACVT